MSTISNKLSICITCFVINIFSSGFYISHDNFKASFTTNKGTPIAGVYNLNNFCNTKLCNSVP